MESQLQFSCYFLQLISNLITGFVDLVGRFSVFKIPSSVTSAVILIKQIGFNIFNSFFPDIGKRSPNYTDSQNKKVYKTRWITTEPEIVVANTETPMRVEEIGLGSSEHSQEDVPSEPNDIRGIQVEENFS